MRGEGGVNDILCLAKVVADLNYLPRIFLIGFETSIDISVGRAPILSLDTNS